jgi:catechol 2,3-dioxygenase-like lactoylglutathione lyase family enzyme
MQNGWELRHLGMIVKDIEKAAEFYKKLGWKGEEIKDLSFPAGVLEVNGEPSETPIRIKATEFQIGNLTVEFIEPIEGDFVHSQWLQNSGEGANHVSFGVADLKAEKAEMIANGFPYIFGSDGFAFFDTLAVGNLTIELNQK